MTAATRRTLKMVQDSRKELEAKCDREMANVMLDIQGILLDIQAKYRPMFADCDAEETELLQMIRDGKAGKRA